MFQKLYRHLEEIKTSLQEERPGVSNEVGETIIVQLESMNATLLQLQQELAVGNNATARVDTRRRLPIRQILLAAVIIPLLLFMAFSLSQINRSLSNQAVDSATAMAGVSQVTRSVVTDSAHLAENRLAIEKHLATLDSLIAGQQQSLEELKKLNTTAVTTMQRIRRHFVLSEHAAAATPTAAIEK